MVARQISDVDMNNTVVVTVAYIMSSLSCIPHVFAVIHTLSTSLTYVIHVM